MITEKDIRNYINQYLYALNKYNIFGGIIAYALAVRFKIITSDSTKHLKTSLKTHFKSIFLLLLTFIIIKEVLKRIFNIKDICECKDPLEDEYVHPEYKSCPKERTLMNMLSDVKFLVQGKTLNWLYKYNFAGLILTFLIGSVLGLTVRTKNAKIIVNLIMILSVFVSFKLIVNLFFKPRTACHCPYKLGD